MRLVDRIHQLCSCSNPPLPLSVGFRFGHKKLVSSPLRLPSSFQGGIFHIPLPMQLIPLSTLCAITQLIPLASLPQICRLPASELPALILDLPASSKPVQ